MLIKLIRAIISGLIIAAVLLLAVPTLRSTTGEIFSGRSATDDETPLSFNQAVRRSAPAVVNVYNRSMDTHSHNELQIRTLGSGVIMNEKGYVLTNKHVINNAEQIIVALQDGRVYEAMLVGSDSLTDLAVLKINAKDLPVIPINPHRAPHIGDVVLAIGNPYNLGQTVTQGIISATGRVGLSPSGRQNFLQTDASINHGNSGGALVNTLGEMVGINTLSFDKSNNGETPEGIGFAIPTALATKVMNKLIRDGRVIRGYIGIGGRDVAPLHASGANMDRIQGIIVNEVTPGGPAAQAGIQVNDVILSVNNKPAVSALETMDQVAEIRPGAVIPVVILRNGTKMTLNVTVQEYPSSE
ncbi:outer membrane-stress sensor serine endopeptidase DegS [Martelella alba]|uniref:Outer membrane-stress sensor serine endopeptidase DegS n=1 Tax=Martelella alba TaxID=2590451 RepID=A0ABY2SNP7_9HYPH|nr:outer membrane-stress sensor serine endopeptidase DegS [Martelella alba]TKI06914.1 outer membrane-stress sensor serine endopeptidase DegS [Martelella alba]